MLLSDMPIASRDCSAKEDSKILFRREVIDKANNRRFFGADGQYAASHVLIKMINIREQGEAHGIGLFDAGTG